MNRETFIAPSILSADFAEIGNAVKLIESSGGHYVHCDVMDGEFVPNITFGMKAIADIRKRTALPLDVHLMIVKPERYLAQFVKAGANVLTFHVEAVTSPIQGIRIIKDLGAECGLAISPSTSVEVLYPYLSLLNTVTVMGVHPGFGAQSYIPTTTAKIAELSAEIERQGLSTNISVDGGVNLQNIAEIKSAGANVIVAGNAFFNSESPASFVRSILSQPTK